MATPPDQPQQPSPGWTQGPPPGYPPQPGYSPPPGYPQQYPPQPQGGYGPPGYPPAPPQGYQPYGYPGYAAPGYGPPPSHLGWAITALIFFWPLAIAAFINHSRVESSFYRGDVAGAEHASRQVRKFGIIALCVGLGVVLLWLIVVLTVVSTFGCGGSAGPC